MPTTGVTPRHMPMFSKTWKVSIPAKPAQRSMSRWLPERSLEEAERWYLGRLRGRKTLSREAEQKVGDFLREISVDGVVRERIDTTLVNMYWSVKR